MENLKIKSQNTKIKIKVIGHRLWVMDYLKNLLPVFIIFSFLILIPTIVIGADRNQSFQFIKDPQIQQVKPKKPVRIKLHRNAKGEYSWDLTGDNVDEVVQTDKRLRKLLKVE